MVQMETIHHLYLDAQLTHQKVGVEVPLLQFMLQVPVDLEVVDLVRLMEDQELKDVVTHLLQLHLKVTMADPQLALPELIPVVAVAVERLELEELFPEVQAEPVVLVDVFMELVTQAVVAAEEILLGLEDQVVVEQERAQIMMELTEEPISVVEVVE
jgi:hypothetical protein